MFGMPYRVAKDALAFVIKGHEGQTRKDGVTPYVVHPIGVADIVYEWGGSDEQIRAALFHDLIEDTDVTYEDIRYRYGCHIADLVAGLTNTSKLTNPEKNRAERHQMDIDRLLDEHDDVLLVKLADILYNINDLSGFTPGFARKFLGEKKAVVEAFLEHFIRNSSLQLHRRAEHVYTQILMQIDNQKG